MSSTTNTASRVLIYTGERFKTFLHRHGISYKDAAEQLCIDKNTVGKAVRGGNMNVDIILRICNTYGMQITDFFKVVGRDENGKEISYYFSTEAELLSEISAGENDFNYKKCENNDIRLSVIADIMEDSQQKIDTLVEAYNNCRQSLSELLEKEYEYTE